MEAKDDEERTAAFRGVLPYIAQIKSYYDFSILIGICQFCDICNSRVFAQLNQSRVIGFGVVQPQRR